MAEKVVGLEKGPKIRFMPLSNPFDVVLFEPEIPQNTGSIARTCAAVGVPLHLVGKLGFKIDDHSVKRAGLDYWDKVKVITHKDFDEYLLFAKGRKVLLFSSRAPKPYTVAPYEEGCSLVFGKETAGLPDYILNSFTENIYGIPTLPSIRSLNLSNAVAIVVYECLRQLGALNSVYIEE